MSIISAFQSGVYGIEQGLERINKDATIIARPQSLVSADSVTTPLVDMIAAKQHVEASAKVLETSATLLGRILDIKV